MNKKELANTLKDMAKITLEDSLKIVNLVENNFGFISNNDSEVINLIRIELNYDYDKSNHVYRTLKGIIKDEIKRKLKHPFSVRKS